MSKLVSAFYTSPEYGEVALFCVLMKQVAGGLLAVFFILYFVGFQTGKIISSLSSLHYAVYSIRVKKLAFHF